MDRRLARYFVVASMLVACATSEPGPVEKTAQLPPAVAAEPPRPDGFGPAFEIRDATFRVLLEVAPDGGVLLRVAGDDVPMGRFESATRYVDNKGTVTELHGDVLLIHGSRTDYRVDERGRLTMGGRLIAEFDGNGRLSAAEPCTHHVYTDARTGQLRLAMLLTVSLFISPNVTVFDFC